MWVFDIFIAINFVNSPSAYNLKNLHNGGIDSAALGILHRNQQEQMWICERIHR